MRPQLIEAVIRHHAARVQIIFATPSKLAEVKCALARCRLQDVDCGGDNLAADAVAGNQRDTIAFHLWCYCSGALDRRYGRGCHLFATNLPHNLNKPSSRKPAAKP